MRTLRAVLYAGLFACPALAQEATPEPTPVAPSVPEASRGPKGGSVLHIQKVFVLKHTGTRPMMNLLRAFPATLSESDVQGQQVISVSAAPAVVAVIEETIKRLDVPPQPTRSVEVVASVLECATTSGELDTTPAEFRDVVAQLKRTFNYGGCAVTQTLMARAVEGERFQATSRTVGTSRHTLNATVKIEESQAGTLIQFSGFSLGDLKGAGFNGTVDIRDGQRVVLGTLGNLESGKAGVLVLAAKVLP